ncbi:LPXTG cell wall anchor domain-containing protein [Nocardioides sp. 503]|uniref:LPXTG cell wall anchor domain-containing protein n=1 Tax=Nocardioides sp. 503 TaxID=2508326 RepID=UPI00106F7670|nr:LPXTG cell wall anchor domain-containing protein [Nocardioides sp. 503]
MLFVGALLLTNSNETEWFGLMGVLLLGAAGYLLLGGIARGLQLARSLERPDPG